MHELVSIGLYQLCQGVLLRLRQRTPIDLHEDVRRPQVWLLFSLPEILSEHFRLKAFDVQFQHVHALNTGRREDGGERAAGYLRPVTLSIRHEPGYAHVTTPSANPENFVAIRDTDVAD